MKKKLLFIMPKLGSGGAEKALTTLLSLLDYDKYDVDLMLFRREGIFLADIPEKVNIIDGGENYAAFDASAAAYIKSRLIRFDFKSALNRIVYSEAVNNSDRAKTWRCLKKALDKPQKHYDIAVAYLEGNSIYYCIDCIDADRKIGYVHNDYNGLGLDKNFDKPYFEKLDNLVTVSDECANVLCKTFPESAHKVRMLENIISPSLLKSLAKTVPEEYEPDTKKLLTIGRFSAQKGYDMAVRAAEILDKKGYDFKWFAVGKGELMSQIKEEISNRSLEGKFILLGEKSNPYPYIKGCDIYVQSSYFEGKSIAIDEAKAFSKPIVCTSFPTVYDQLTNGETALLAQINPESIAQKIEELFNDEALCKTLSDNLKKEKTGNEEEIDKFYKLLEGKL